MRNICFCFILLLFIFSGCSKSGKRRDIPTVPAYKQPSLAKANSSGRSPSVVKMTKVNGVYEVPTEVNGVPMSFIFDTGAGMISISNTEAGFLYKQGKLAEEDIVGSENFMDANGDVSEGLVIILREVKVGNRILRDVKASVVPNLKAPLLLGQSALEKFGRVSIDYGNRQIVFD